MFKKNCVIEIGDNYVIKHDFHLKFLKRVSKKHEYNINLLKESNFHVNNSKAYIVLEDEKINIKHMTLPKVKKQGLYRLIIDELSCSYNNVDKILFNFSIIKDNGKNVDVVVFYSNEGKLKRLEKYILSNSFVYKVYLIQFCFLRYFKTDVKHNNFIFVFMYKSKLYFLCCINRKVMCNNTEVFTSGQRVISGLIYEFVESYRINKGVEIENIYTVNLDDETCNDALLKEYSIKNLGNIDEITLINSIRGNR